MEGKKKCNGLVITLIVLLLAFATVGTLLFTGLIKSPMVKEDNKCTKCETKVDDDTKKDSTTVKTADERYKEYIDKLSSSVENLSGFQSTSYYTSGNYRFSITIEKTKELSIGVATPELDKHSQVVATDVLAYFITDVGNGGNHSIYYLNSNGEIYVESLEEFANKEKMEFKKVDNVKNIIQVISTVKVDENGVGGHSAAFVDIDGNIITK